MTLPTGNRGCYLFTLLLLIVAQQVLAQTKGPVSYVNPFIGTTKSNVPTKWGSEGGTYPGAVAPNGSLQLTPETRVTGARGYDYSDSVIYAFSCLHHFSGFPGGSAGELLVMPVEGRAVFQAGVYKRRFSHRNEKATPGYYSVLFPDDHTLVEATATVRAGMFRFTFPPQVTPQLFISDSGRYHAALRFSAPAVSRHKVKGGYVVQFAAAASGPTVILLRISASMVSKESAEKNLAAELHAGFDEVHENTRQAWAKALSTVEITDSNEARKTIFYTALYHALLMPWVISDVDGNYRGADRQVHTVTGRVAYGGFSPWDTFRSLHPLLCLLYPDKQREMVLSMLDIYRQTGYLPVESMTGNHAVPIIVDSYLKGITGIDSTLAYTAMKKSIADTPHLQPDMAIFRQQGYIPFSYPESVTRTVEYAYDDWALAQFAGQVMQQPAAARRFTQSSYNYRHLFHAGDMLMLPRMDSAFKLQPGTSGYKEGDPWVYSYFVPQHEQDLVNLMGGKRLFTERLDAALAQQQIIFDNETVFHVPWLFNAAGAPYKTQQWIGAILNRRFSATPGGLPGNDDLGSTSSWYVFSAMGLYPICPGRPVYTMGTPLFRSLRIHLQNGRQVEIKRTAGYPYVSAVTLDGTPYQDQTLSHARLIQGGTLAFETSATPAGKWPAAEDSTREPAFSLQHFALSKEKVIPHERFWVRFTLHNNGSLGTKQVQLRVNGQVYGYRNCLADSGVTITDSIACRLYRPGVTRLTLNGTEEMTITVLKPDHPLPVHPEIRDLAVLPLIKKGSRQQVTFTVQNTGWAARDVSIPVTLQGSLLFTAKVSLQPGEEKRFTRQFPVKQAGWQTLAIYGSKEKFKVYETGPATLLLDLHLQQGVGDSLVTDHSGFGNHGHIIREGGTAPASKQQSLLLGKDCFVEIPNARSLDVMGETITMMAWVYPAKQNSRGLVDLFTKGDIHVLQVAGNKTLIFFAGGWGRGECSADLPGNWEGQWHHIAGVCDGSSLRIYIDGQLKASTPLEDKTNLSVTNRWNIGRNEEFPSARIFNGYMDHVKVFAAPLPEAVIREVMDPRPE